MCTCDANFDNMSGFVKANGFDDVLDWSDGFLANINEGTVWGKFDHYLFDRLLDVANDQDSTFFVTAFTQRLCVPRAAKSSSGLIILPACDY